MNGRKPPTTCCGAARSSGCSSLRPNGRHSRSSWRPRPRAPPEHPGQRASLRFDAQLRDQARIFLRVATYQLRVLIDASAGRLLGLLQERFANLFVLERQTHRLVETGDDVVWDATRYEKSEPLIDHEAVHSGLLVG